MNTIKNIQGERILKNIYNEQKHIISQYVDDWDLFMNDKIPAAQIKRAYKQYAKRLFILKNRFEFVIAASGLKYNSGSSDIDQTLEIIARYLGVSVEDLK